jgi:hypothetical protein
VVLVSVVLPARAVFYQDGYRPCFESFGTWWCDTGAGIQDYVGQCEGANTWLRSCATAYNAEYSRCGRVYRNDEAELANCVINAQATFDNCLFSTPVCPPPN